MQGWLIYGVAIREEAERVIANSIATAFADSDSRTFRRIPPCCLSAYLQKLLQMQDMKRSEETNKWDLLLRMW